MFFSVSTFTPLGAATRSDMLCFSCRTTHGPRRNHDRPAACLRHAGHDFPRVPRILDTLHAPPRGSHRQHAARNHLGFYLIIFSATAGSDLFMSSSSSKKYTTAEQAAEAAQAELRAAQRRLSKPLPRPLSPQKDAPGGKNISAAALVRSWQLQQAAQPKEDANPESETPTPGCVGFFDSNGDRELQRCVALIESICPSSFAPNILRTHPSRTIQAPSPGPPGPARRAWRHQRRRAHRRVRSAGAPPKRRCPPASAAAQLRSHRAAAFVPPAPRGGLERAPPCRRWALAWASILSR